MLEIHQIEYDLREPCNFRPDEEDEYAIRQRYDIKGPGFEDLKDCVKEIVKQLYSTDALDVAKLDDVVAWLAEEVNVSVPQEQPAIERKKESQSQFYLSLAEDMSRLIIR